MWICGYVLSDKVWQNESYTICGSCNISKLIYHRGPDDNGIYINQENKLGLSFSKIKYSLIYQDMQSNQ